MIAAALIGAGVGLVVGAGLGFLLAALFKGGYIAELEQQVDELGERCDGYVAELDALTESTRPADDTPDLSDVLAGRIRRPGFDANPTVLLAPGQTYEQWYEAYANTLDGWAPGWWEDIDESAAPQLLALAMERRRETYAQQQLDNDRLPTEEGFAEREARRAGSWAEQGQRAAAEMTDMEADAFRRRWSATGTGEHRPGIAMYPPRKPKED